MWRKNIEKVTFAGPEKSTRARSQRSSIVWLGSTQSHHAESVHASQNGGHDGADGAESNASKISHGGTQMGGRDGWPKSGK